MDKKEIKIQVTEKEYAKIKEKALAKNMSVRAYAKMAVLQRRDRKTVDESHIFYYKTYEMLVKFTAILSSVDSKLLQLFGLSEKDSAYVDALIDADLDFRRLARAVTELTRAMSGEINNGNS